MDSSPRLTSRKYLRTDGRVNYQVHVVTFQVVREADAGDPRQLGNPEAVVALVEGVGLIPDDAKEHFFVLLLDAQNTFVAAHPVSTGTLSVSLIHPREVFAPAVRLAGVASLILVHNHPSGDPLPSQEDLRLTRQLKDAGKLLDLRVHDHVILGNGTGRWVSLAQRGVL